MKIETEQWRTKMVLFEKTIVPSLLSVGTIVRIIRPSGVLYNQAGSLGVCYEKSIQFWFGSSFIFENGQFETFSLENQITALEKVGFKEEYKNYKFKNNLQLLYTFDRGYWMKVLGYRHMRLKAVCEQNFDDGR